MIKEIKYNGYTANPSDYENADGDLATAIGVVPEDGTLKPILPPAVKFTLTPPNNIVYIHNASAFTHYIVYNKSTNTAKWFNGDVATGNVDAKLIPLRSFSAEIYGFNALGNTLVILTADGMHYFLWKGQDNAYKYLGTDMPECSLSFGLQAEMKRTEEFTISISINENNIYNEFSDDEATNVTSQVLAKVNKFIAEESTEKGKFIYPFLVRYAYRLYDGSLTRHSAPVLMICSSDIAPRVFWFNLHGKDGKYTSAKLRVVSPVHILDYALTSNVSSLSNWKDIIKSVDIFVSKPIYTYDQNGKCSRFQNGGEDLSGYSVCKHINQAVSTTTYPLRYQYNEFGKLYAFTFTPNELPSRPGGILHTPQKSVDAVKEDIRNCSQFYFLESIKIDALKTDRTALNIKEDYLQSLVTREVMSDDYDSHDKLIANYSFAYNQRLNISGVKKQLFGGFDAKSQFCFSNGYVYNWADADPTTMDMTESIACFIFIKQDGQDIVVRGQYGSFGLFTPVLFLYYPNVNAYKAIINKSMYVMSDYYEVPLEQHSFLNGSFYYGGWEDLSVKTFEYPTISTAEQRVIDTPNKIYSSEVGNPFYFPLLGINTIGTGNILGICSAAKALSQGQFGQFPLYAFSTDGVWALEISATGTYSAKQPITRDVCSNPDSITQIDSAVLFATDRGIMLLSGSTAQCISDILMAERIFTLGDLHGGGSIADVYNKSAAESEQLTIEDITFLPFLNFLASCRMLYDYTHQRIIVYNPSVRYAYVYSLKTQAWGMMQSRISSHVNSYPEALAMVSDKLVDFSTSDATGITALIVTRPFVMDDANMLKTIDVIIQRGYFKGDHISQVLYGSRDLFNWQPIWSSVDKHLRGFRGTPYKAFRLALVCRLDKTESIFGCTVQFNPRMLNQPR